MNNFCILNLRDWVMGTPKVKIVNSCMPAFMPLDQRPHPKRLGGPRLKGLPAAKRGSPATEGSAARKKTKRRTPLQRGTLATDLAHPLPKRNRRT